MITYNKRKPEARIPVWRNERFPRMQGLLDSILHKVVLRPAEGGDHCVGGWFERQRRSLREFESAMEQSLDQQIRPTLEAYQRACRAAQSGPLLPEGTAPRSTAQARAMREQARCAEQARQAAGTAASLRGELTVMIAETDRTIRRAYEAADVAAARYAKATRFHPLEQEIPRFGPPAFDPQAFAERIGLTPEKEEAE